MTVGAVKEGQEEYRRGLAGGGPVVATPQGRGGRYYLRPDYSLPPPPHHHPHPPRHDYHRDYLPPEDLYRPPPVRHKDDFFGTRKEREELASQGGYGGPSTPDDPFSRTPSSSAASRSRLPERFTRLQDYPPGATTPEGRGNGMYGPGAPATANGPNNGTGSERVSRLLELYGTLDGRGTASSRSNHDLYGSLDGRASRLSDIFPTSEARLRQNSEYRNDETRSLSGREGVLADLYRRRELPPAPPEYRPHEYRPRHDFRGQVKSQQQQQQAQQQQQSQQQQQQSQQHLDQDVIENPMYDVERRSVPPPRTPGPRVATPTTTPPPPHHSHMSHLTPAHHPSSITPSHHSHGPLHATPGHTPSHPVVVHPNHPQVHPNHPSHLNHTNHPGSHQGHMVGHSVGHIQSHGPSHQSGLGGVGDRSEHRYNTTAIAQQEEAHR